jgi:hypothetical protein
MMNSKNALNPIAVQHIGIHDNDVRFELECLLRRFVACAGFTNNNEARLLTQNGNQSSTENWVFIYNQHPGCTSNWHKQRNYYSSSVDKICCAPVEGDYDGMLQFQS